MHYKRYYISVDVLDGLHYQGGPYCLMVPIAMLCTDADVFGWYFQMIAIGIIILYFSMHYKRYYISVDVFDGLHFQGGPYCLMVRIAMLCTAVDVLGWPRLLQMLIDTCFIIEISRWLVLWSRCYSMYYKRYYISRDVLDGLHFQGGPYCLMVPIAMLCTDADVFWWYFQMIAIGIIILYYSMHYKRYYIYVNVLDGLHFQGGP